jgi:hypothetical protein
MKTRIMLLAISMFFQGASFAADLPDYIRFAEDTKSARLEVAIRTFTMPSGQKVDLVGAVHIADDTYYQELNRRFEAYDSVLFELVGDPERLTAPEPLAGGGAVSVIQQAAGEYLHLTFQLSAIDYSKKNMVHADTTAEEFEKMQKERGETMLTLFARAMQVQASGKIDSAAMRELDTIALIRILLSQDSAAAFKKALARMFDQVESMTAAMEGEGGSAVLSGRNDVVMGKLATVLANRKQRRIAVFYGGAHMPGIESALIRDLKAKATGEEWLAAWTMPKGDPPAAAGASPFPRK